MDEFDFIRRHLAPIAGKGAEGLDDDCTWIADGEGWIVVSTDTAIEGVHFPRGMRGASATERAVRIAASDIAAKGTTPVGMWVALSLPRDLDERWLAGLALGLDEAATVLGLPLLGGDTTRHEGDLSITVTVMGRAPHKVLRSGARAGDTLYLSGPIGDGALGLDYIQGHPAAGGGAALTHWENAYLRPHIDFAAGREIVRVASAATDISDGLLADAANIARASGVAVTIDADAIPFSDATAPIASSTKQLQRLVTAGDDYVVLFTGSAGLTLGHPIGLVGRGQGVRLDRAGKDITPDRLGYTY